MKLYRRVIIGVLFFFVGGYSFLNAQVLFSDNFNRADGPVGDAWTISSADWVIEGNTLKGTSASGHTHAHIFAGSDTWGNYVLEYKFLLDATSDDVGCFFRYGSSGTFDWGATRGDTHHLRGPGWEEFVHAPIDFGNWVSVRVEVNGFNIKVYVNGNLRHDYTDPGTGPIQGKIGFNVWPYSGGGGGRVVYFDDVIVTRIAPPQHLLTMGVSPSGGGLTNPEIGDHTYDEGTVVNITATPNPGYEFVSWAGDVADPNAQSTTVTMDAAKSITANFQLVQHTLTMATNPSAGGTTNPSSGDYSYSHGTVVNISATPNPGYEFVSWAGDVADPNAQSTTVTMNSNKTVTANYCLGLPFTDNFEDDDFPEWQIISGDWSIVEKFGNKVLRGETTNDLNALINVGDSTWKDYTVSFDVFGESCDDKVVFVRYLDDNNAYDLDLNSHSPNRGLWLRRFQGGNEAFQTKFACDNYTNQWYHIDFGVHGESIKVYVDSMLVIDMVDSGTCVTRGGVRFGVWNPNGRVNYFDNVRIDTARINMSTEIKEEEGHTDAASLYLYQNYPNPFNPITNIQYLLPEISDVSITVINVKGRKIASLFEGRKQAGMHTLVWDASNLPSGVYFIRMRAGSFTSLKKCMLIK